MNYLKIALSLIICAACSPTKAKILDGETKYAPPTATLNVQNSREYNSSYDRTWKAVITHLSDTAFVIDNIDKDSGLITVSFSVTDPRTAIDCGNWSTWVKNMRGRRDYNFEGATPFSQYEMLVNRTLTNIERNVTLSGKFNILVTSNSEQASRIKVTARYVSSLSMKVSAFSLDANFNRVPAETISDSLSFNTGQEAKLTKGQTICRSKGTLETAVLDGITAALADK